jgi:hypothetical protein
MRNMESGPASRPNDRERAPSSLFTARLGIRHPDRAPELIRHEGILVDAIRFVENT